MHRPTRLEKKDQETLTIVWEDGHEGVHNTFRLREACPCAQCRDEWTGERLVLPGQLPRAVAPVEIRPVGQYGLQITWSDGHSKGIYTFDALRAICECCVCRTT